MCTIHVDVMFKQSRVFDVMNNQTRLIRFLISLWMPGFVVVTFVEFLIYLIL